MVGLWMLRWLAACLNSNVNFAQVSVAVMPEPIVVVEVSGGLIQDMNSSTPVRVIVLDGDTEGSEDFRLINGTDYLVTSHASVEEDAAYVEHIVQEVDSDEDQEPDNRAIADDQRIFIEKLGYNIEADSDQPGLWTWTAPSDGCDISFHTAKEALNGAWSDAVAQTLSISGITCETGELPRLDDLSPDTQMEWVERVRETYPDISPKEAFRLAVDEYAQNDGVIPKSAVTESPKP
jgi:hypothetical protein